MTVSSTPVTHRRSTRWRDLAWLAWRQHRTVLVITTVLAFALSAMLIASSVIPNETGLPRFSPAEIDLLEPRKLATYLSAYGGVVAVFWSAPLLPREFEQRTHFLVWSQDVSPRRWLTGKVLALAAAAVALGLLLGTVGWVTLTRLEATADYERSISLFDGQYFGAAPLVQAGYALFGLALGLLAGLLTRRTVAAMAAAGIGYFATRLVVLQVLRPHYLTPVRSTSPLGPGQGGPFDQPTDALFVASGYLDAAGNPVSLEPGACLPTRPTSMSDRIDCLHAKGIVSEYVDYQPIERLDTFHVIEFGVFTLLAAGLFAIVWRLTRGTIRL